MRKILLTLSLAIVFVTPSWAVFNEKDFPQTLQVLRYELCKTYSEMETNQKNFMSRDNSQHDELVKLMKSCNELSLMLYSQKQDFTFDLTYALQQVTDQYYSFTSKRMPFDEIIEYLDVEIDRYNRLVKSLRRLPPSIREVPDSVNTAFLDSLSQSLRERVFAQDGMVFGLRIGPRGDKPDSLGRDSAAVSAINSDAPPRRDSTQRRNRAKWGAHKSFALDSLSVQDRDSCLFYASSILSMLVESRTHIVEDNDRYNQTDKRLKEFFDYAQERYTLVQKNIFMKGQDNYWKVLTHLKPYSQRAFRDASDKYSRSSSLKVKSEWRGPMVVGFTFMVLIYLLIAAALGNLLIQLLMKKVKLFKTEEFKKRRSAWIILVSLVIFVLGLWIAKLVVRNANFFTMASTLLIEYLLLVLVILASVSIRTTGQGINSSIKLFTPVLLLGLLVITFRIIFIPNSLITLIFPPLLLFFFFWQLAAVKRNGEKVPKIDRFLAGLSLFLTVVTLVMSLVGYVLLSLQVYIWWIFQLAILLFVVACGELLQRFREDKVDKRVREYKLSQKSMDLNKKGALIEVTWLYDFLDMALIPVMYVLSFPSSLYLASKVFDLTELTMKLFSFPILYSAYIHISLYKILLVTGLFYIFKYICYALRGFYRIYKFRMAISKSGKDFIHENEVNLTLANNVISILVWGLFVIISIMVMKIPTKSLSVITAGLAAGIGFAMKDVLNNFFYGVQLMSGRLRVGDYIECDGIRGKVDNINYQSTQIIAIDGSVMEFPNSSLFNKNFKNLTRNHSYEYIALPVGVAYGTDVDKVREIILSALEPLRKPDKYGREVVDPKYGVKVTLNDFGDSSLNLMVKQFVLVEQHYNYVATANELIYNALNSNGIEIPFPQQDVYVKQFPSGEKNEKND